MVHSNSNGVIKGVFWSSLKNWGTRITTLAVFLVVGRLLSPADIGLFFYIMGTLTIAGVFGDLGLAEYVVYNKTDDCTETSIWLLQVGASVLIAIGIGASVWFGLWSLPEKTPQASAAFLTLLLTLPLTAAVRIPEALMRHRMEFQALAMRSISSIIAGAVIAVALASAGAGIWALVVKQMVEVLADTLLYFSLSHWRPKTAMSISALKIVFRGGWGIIGSRIIDIIGQKADALIVGGVLGMASLGQYSMALRVFQVLNEGIVQPVIGVIATAFAHTKDDPDKRRVFFLTSVQFASLITLPVFVLAWFFGSTWVPALFGMKWQQAGTLFQTLCISGLLIGYSGLNGYSLLANNKNRAFMFVIIFATAVALGLLAVTSQIGIEAVAFTMPLKAAATFPISLWLAQNLMGFKWSQYGGALTPALMSGATVLLIALGTRHVTDIIASSIGIAHGLALEATTLMLTITMCGLLGFKLLKPRLLSLRNSLRL